MEFLIKTSLTRDQVMEYHRVSGKTLTKVKTTLLRSGLLLFGALTVIGSIKSITLGHIQAGVIVGIILGLLAVGWSVTWYQRLARKTLRFTPENSELKFYFSEDGAVAKNGEAKMILNYRDFQFLAETEDNFFIFPDKNSGYILDKTGFQIGTPVEFRDFIHKMTGKDVTFVKLSA